MGNKQTIAIPDRRRSSKGGDLHVAAAEVSATAKPKRKSGKHHSKKHRHHHRHGGADSNTPSMEFNNASTSDGTQEPLKRNLTDQDRVRMALLGDASGASHSAGGKSKRRVSSTEFRNSASHMDPQDVIAQLEKFANQDVDASDYFSSLKASD